MILRDDIKEKISIEVIKTLVTRFDNFQEGDYLIFSNNIVRCIIRKGQHSNSRVRIKPRTYLTFNKIKGFGTTTYLYHDIKHKIKGVVKLKKTKKWVN